MNTTTRTAPKTADFADVATVVLNSADYAVAINRSARAAVLAGYCEKRVTKAVALLLEDGGRVIDITGETLVIAPKTGDVDEYRVGPFGCNCPDRKYNRDALGQPMACYHMIARFIAMKVALDLDGHDQSRREVEALSVEDLVESLFG